MFEKEAVEYREKGKRDGYYLVTQEMEQEGLDYIIDETFKDAAEFGYNKANEWHYVKSGDLPRNDTKVLVLLENKRLKISTFMKNMFTLWNRDYDTYTKLYGVYAWKEIILPEELEEN